MSTANPIRFFPLSPTANERFKQHFSSVFWVCVGLAVVIHFVVMASFPTMRVQNIYAAHTSVLTMELPPEIEIPKPPPAIARPAVPVVGNASLNEAVTIAPTTFQANPIETLPPPPTTGAGTREIAAAPTFTPFTVSPELKNRAEVQATLERYYPLILKEAGIGGTVVLWFLIDTEGRVLKTQLNRSSGYEAFDIAATKVAEVMRFSPAYNRDKKVTVWVQLPVVFEVQ